jgi:hypothetical protein
MTPREERIVVLSSSIHYHIKGLRHRQCGPALIYTNGTLVWYRSGRMVKSIQENGLVEIFPVKK